MATIPLEKYKVIGLNSTSILLSNGRRFEVNHRIEKMLPIAYDKGGRWFLTNLSAFEQDAMSALIPVILESGYVTNRDIKRIDLFREGELGEPEFAILRKYERDQTRFMGGGRRKSRKIRKSSIKRSASKHRKYKHMSNRNH